MQKDCEEYMLIPIGPDTPNWVMGRLITALMKSDLIRIIEAGPGIREAYVEVRPVKWGTYTRFYYVGAGFQQFLEACISQGEPIIVEEGKAYYKIAAKEATLEYMRCPK